MLSSCGSRLLDCARLRRQSEADGRRYWVGPVAGPSHNASGLANLTIVEAVETVISDFPSVTVVGMADDYRFVGPALDVLAAAARYAELVKGPGHVFSVLKSKVWSPSVETLRLVACHPFVLGCPSPPV
eukprot:COSAG01_NODE_26485_length_712_cov_1.889070_1_plen_129_part_00